MKKLLFNFVLISFLIPAVDLTGGIIYVSTTGAGIQNGSTWDNAIAGTNLQNTINSATAGDSIWVACGTYYPTAGTNRTISFNMRNNIEIYGGFNGAEASLIERDLACGPCSILSGDIGQTGVSPNYSHTVVSNSSLNSSAILDGFTIEDANDNSGLSNNGAGLGGGIYNHGLGSGNNCSPTFRNLLVQNCSAVFGGGAFNNGYNGGTSNPIYINCIFYQNHATNEAGGMDSYGVNGTANPTLYNCIFYENTSDSDVGAMYAWGGNGGVANPTMYNCAFANNQALSGYAGAFIADAQGGGPTSGTSIVTMQNCIVWGNTSTSGPDQFYVDGPGASVVATYSNIDMTNQTGPHILSGSGTGNVFTDPLFINISDADGADNCWFTEDDGLSLLIASLNINAGNGIDLSSIDIINNERIIGTAPDIGAYEFVLQDSVLWTGANGTDWFDPTNWNPERTPDSVQVVTIPDITNQPIILGDTAYIRNLILEGRLNVLSTGQLQVID